MRPLVFSPWSLCSLACALSPLALYLCHVPPPSICPSPQVRRANIMSVGDIREVEQALKLMGDWDPFHPPIPGHAPGQHAGPGVDSAVGYE